MYYYSLDCIPNAYLKKMIKIGDFWFEHRRWKNKQRRFQHIMILRKVRKRHANAENCFVYGESVLNGREMIQVEMKVDNDQMKILLENKYNTRGGQHTQYSNQAMKIICTRFVALFNTHWIQIKCFPFGINCNGRWKVDRTWNPRVCMGQPK